MSPFFTLSPSLTKIADTIPPSRFCITFVCPEGTTLPVPFIVSSIWLKAAHDKKIIKNNIIGITVV